jgi:hypothetical protein
MDGRNDAFDEWLLVGGGMNALWEQEASRLRTWSVNPSIAGPQPQALIRQRTLISPIRRTRKDLRDPGASEIDERCFVSSPPSSTGIV